MRKGKSAALCFLIFAVLNPVYCQSSSGAKALVSCQPKICSKIAEIPSFGVTEKIALSAYGENARRLSELFFAQYSEQYEFVERTLLSEVEQERFLQQKFGLEKRSRQARLAGASIFMVFQDLPDGKIQIAMFETDCGFRLKTTFPDEKNLAQLKTELDHALENIQNPEKIRFFSFAGIRNKLHYSFEEQAQAVSSELIERTWRLPVVFLERDYLLELLLEQELTGKWASAVSASEILHFELNPGDKAENFVISAYFTDADEKITSRHTIEETANISRLFGALATYAAAPRPGKSYTLKNEATRFAQEAELARIHHAPEQAVKFYFAAFALDQSNTKYLNAIGYYSDRQKFPEVYPFYRAALEYLTRHEELLNHYETHSGALFLCNIIKQKLSELELSEQANYSSFLARHRDKFLNAVRVESIQPFALDHALNKFSHIVPELYPSIGEYRIAMSSTWINILSLIKTGRPAAMSEEHWQHLLKNTIYNRTEQLFRLQAVLPSNELPVWTLDVCRDLDELGIEALRPLSLILEINALLYSAEYSEEKVMALFQEYSRLSREQKAGEPGRCIFYDHQKFSEFPGLLNKIRQGRIVLPPPERMETKTSKILSEYRDDSEKILYFLTYDDFDFKMMKRDETNSETVLATFPKNFQDQMAVRQGDLWRIHSDGKHIVATDSNHVYSGESVILKELRKFPFQIKFAVICDGRIYLAGDREFLSCNFQGEDRQVIFSASQAEKILDIQARYPNLKVQGIFADKVHKSCYVELADRQYREVIQFDVKSGKIIRNSTFAMQKHLDRIK